MKRFLYQNRLLLLLFFLSLLVKGITLYPNRIETLYTYGAYPIIAKSLRIAFGWLPFSIGDILYFLAFCYMVYALIIGVRFFKRNRFTLKSIGIAIKTVVTKLLVIYLLFNLLWGLNYYRTGIAAQLGLKVAPYTLTELNTLTAVLQQRLNEYAAKIDTSNRRELNNNTLLFKRGIATYHQVAQPYPCLTYSYLSIKPSLYSNIGYYFGFTGYYNPFTGEAQLNTIVPGFLKPFIITHEIAHQLGYSKENEANLVAYLACRNANDMDFRYSAYFELFLYALNDMKRKKNDTDIWQQFTLHPQVLKDYEALKQYLIRTENPIEPYISRFYNQYLKWNNQPKGLQTYNMVVAWLIAYQRKYGVDSI